MLLTTPTLACTIQRDNTSCIPWRLSSPVYGVGLSISDHSKRPDSKAHILPLSGFVRVATVPLYTVCRSCRPLASSRSTLCAYTGTPLRGLPKTRAQSHRLPTSLMSGYLSTPPDIRHYFRCRTVSPFYALSPSMHSTVKVVL